jgi:uncharacterized protein DUF5990
MDDEVRCRIVLETPPAGVDYGLQKGRGSLFETVQTQRSDGNDLQFEFIAQARASGSAVDFRGPFIQGPADGRFVYIDIGTFAGQTDTPWSRRLKIPLTGITPHMIRRTSGAGRAVLQACVPGTGRDGSPACASVKDFDGWKVARPSSRESGERAQTD